MIFWMGAEKYAHFLIQISYAEAISVKMDVNQKYPLRSLSRRAGDIEGFRFTNFVATEHPEEVKIYELVYPKYSDSCHFRRNEYILKDTLKICDDNTPVEEMGEHVLIKTENVDLIRFLFKAGKRVSWYDPDIEKLGKYFTQFEFEHLFLNLFKVKNVFYPTGEVIPMKDEYGNYAFDFDNGIRKQYKQIKWARKIGYIRRVLDERVNKYRMYRREHLKYGLVKKGLARRCFMPRIGGYYLLWYFNMLSISYMLCKRSIAAIATKKTALRG